MTAARIDSLEPGLITLPNGAVVRRRHNWFSVGDRLRCPLGHSMSPPVLHDGAVTLTCKARSESEVKQNPCGCLVYFAASIPKPFWADVTIDEEAEIRRLGMNASGVARFLRIDFQK